MKRAIIIVLLAFGLSALTAGQSVNNASAEKDGHETSLRVTVSPASLDFGDQEIQTMSKPLQVTLTNNTDKPIEIKKVDMIEDGGNFVVDDDYEFLEETLDAGKSLTVGVVFYPLLAGERTGFLAITYDDANPPQRIPVKGKAIKGSR